MTASAPIAASAASCRFKIKDDKIKYVEGINGPANEGRLCVKGRFGFDYVDHKHRLTKPLIRREDAPAKGLNVDPANPLTHFREATWDEALDAAASGLGRATRRGRNAGRRLRLSQVLERGGLPVPEDDPAGLWPQQRRPLHAVVPCDVRLRR